MRAGLAFSLRFSPLRTILLLICWSYLTVQTVNGKLSVFCSGSDQNCSFCISRSFPGSEFVAANTLAKWKQLEPNEID